MKELLEQLEYAKNAVLSCLKNHAVLVDMHGLAYWAGKVERLREDIKKQLSEYIDEIMTRVY